MKKILLYAMLTFVLLAGMSTQSHAVVSSTVNKNSYLCDGSNTSFSYTFPIILSTDIQVYTIDLNGATTPQTSFSVNTLNHTVTYPTVGSPCTLNYTIVLYRNVPLTQNVAASNQGPAPSPIVMSMSDKLTMEIQQLQEQMNRALVGPISSTTGLALPAASNGTVLGWQGGNLYNFVPNSSTYLTPSTDVTMGGETPTDSLIPTQKAVSIFVNAFSYATAGANSNITSLTGLTTPLTTAQGGTGTAANANTANGALILNSSGQIPSGISGQLLSGVIGKVSVTTFTSQSSVSVPLASGNVYKVMIVALQNTSNSNPTGITFNSDSTSGHYQWVGTYNYVGDATVNPAGSGSATFINVVQPQATSQFMISMDVSTITNGTYNAYIISNASYLQSNNLTQFMVSGLYSSTTVTSMQITPSAGTISGTIYVYQLA